MKKIKNTRNIYEEAITFDNIYAMWKIIKRTCKNRREVFSFSLNVNTNIMNIHNVLKSKTYTPGKYRTFMIFEPKARLVMSQSIFDKIINHFVANYYLIPYLESSLIDANVATRKEKGSSYAMELIKKYINKILINEKPEEIYCLKIDISKYFYSIDHELLIKMIKNRIQDKNVIHLIELIIAETNNDYVNQKKRFYNKKYNTEIPLYKENKGLSIGAMSSQFLAIFYLSGLDHYIKENLGCKYYIRYMDDFLILDTNKERLKEVWRLIDVEVTRLKLKTNNKSNLYRVTNGFNFLGFKYKLVNGKLMISHNKKTHYKIKKKLEYLINHDLVKYKRTLASYYGYFKIIGNTERGDFKMKYTEIFDDYKKKYQDTLVIVKEGIFYSSYFDDGKLLWYLFEYKYVNNKSSFGNTPYDKVIDKLRSLDISFVIVSKEEEVLVYRGDNEVYKMYLNLALKSFEKFTKQENLIKKLKLIFEQKPDSYDELNKYFDKFLDG